MAGSTRTQAGRYFAIATPLGDDILLARSATIREELGRAFVIEAELLSENGEIKFDEIVGASVTFRLALGSKIEGDGDAGQRYFSGIVSQFSQEGMIGDLWVYRATVVPWVWMLSRMSDCRIFQDMTPVEAIEKVFGDRAKGGKFEKGLSATYAKREYQVQYRETDFNFVNRLMEQEGISYFFTHDKENHTCVLADSPSAYIAYPGFEKIRYSEGGAERSDGMQRISSWSVTKVIKPTKVALNDFDFEVPDKALLKKHEIKRTHLLTGGEVFDYPGEYVQVKEGEQYAKIRAEELQSGHEVIQATSNARGIAVGYTFELESPPRADQAGKKWLVTSAVHRITSDDFTSASGQGGGEAYRCSFTAVEATTIFRPARSTPKPTISGLQTAIVVGKTGEEVTVDKHGRVKLKFHWDRYAHADETASCWVRVSQGWAGKGWGMMFLPRHGQEVIVEFLEGDPDRPIVTGRVYNGANVPAYKLPDNQTVSGIKTNSSKGGGGFNEIRFEDKKDSELLYVQAQKDLNTRVLNDSALFVGRDEHATIKRDRVEAIEQDQISTIKRDHTVEIGRDESVKIKGVEKREVTGKQSVTVKDDVAIKNNKNCAIDVTEQFHVKAKEIILEASANLTIKVGSTTIAIEPGGVAIDAKGDVTVTTTGNCKVDAKMAVEAKGTTGFKAEGLEASVTGKAKASLEASGQTVVKGGVVMIN